jgi:predicted membrane protein
MKSVTGKGQVLIISAIPKLILYVFVFFILIRYAIQSGSVTVWNLFIMITIGWVFGVSSFFEHYENMRFRFETEPLFLILAAQVFSRLYSRFQISRRAPLRDLIA